MKRWVRSDRLPEDPSILDNLANKSAGSEEETVPLSEVQRRLVAEPRKRGSVSSSTSKGNSINSSSGSRPLRPVVDLLGGADLSASPTTSTQHRNVVSSPGGNVSVEKARSSPVTRSPAQKPPSTDLLGLDFDSSASVSSHKQNASVSSHTSTASSSAPQTSAAPATPAHNRLDLTKSILSLYSSTPIQANPVPTQTNSNNTFASFQSNNFGGFTSVSPTATAASNTTEPSTDSFSNFQSSALAQDLSTTTAQKSNGLDSLSFLTGNLNLNPAPTTTSTNPPPATKGMSNGFDGLFSTVSNPSTNWSSASPTVNINSIPSVTHNSWTTKENTAANTTTTTGNNNNNNNNGADNSSTWNLSAWDTKPATKTRPSWTSGNEGWGNTLSLNTQSTHFATTADEDDEWDDFKSTGPAAPAGGIKAMEDDIFGNVWK